jgi:hypothetical protein
MNRTSIDDLGGNSALVPMGGAVALSGQFENQATALAAQARAMVESRYVMALRKPRNWEQVRQDLLKECKRPSFAANKSAYYKKPIGDGVEGLGIRFAEVALRCMTNVLVETNTVYEDEQKETCRVSVTDLESNLSYFLDVRVTKTVERSKPMDDGSYVSVRSNSRGNKVYTVPALDDDLLNKRGALISKAVRTLALRVIPGDMQDEAERIILDTRKDTAAKDPDGERRKIVDLFGELGVRAEHLIEFLGHPLEQCSPAELVELRSFYGALDAGDTTWQAIVDSAADRRARQVEGAKAASDRAAQRNAKDAAKTKTAAVDKSAESQARAVDKAANSQGQASKTGDPAPKEPSQPATPGAPTPDEAPKPTPEASNPPGPQTIAASQNSGAPTLEDALRAVNAGDDGLASDIARSLGQAAQRTVAEAMDKRDGGGNLPGFE